MIKVGFICEGKTERAIIGSAAFQQFLKGLNIDCIADIIDAGGNGNLLPQNLSAFTQRLRAKGAEKIIILTDLDTNECITITKERICAPEDHIVIVAVKQIEAWFLADSDCVSAICKTSMCYLFPENPLNPFEEIKALLIHHSGRGVGDKILLTSRCINANFSLTQSALHPNCNSAKYFIEKLKAL